MKNGSSLCHYRQRRVTFTIVEMLVVIAIIVIIAALLMPSLHRAVDSAKDTVCANNMRQTSVGVHMYTDDFGGWLPYKSSSGAQDLYKSSTADYRGQGKLKEVGYIAEGQVEILWCGNEDSPKRQSGSEHRHCGVNTFSKTPPSESCEVDVWYRYGGYAGINAWTPTERITAIRNPGRAGMLMCAGLGGGRISRDELHSGRGFNLCLASGGTVWFNVESRRPYALWGGNYDYRNPLKTLTRAGEYYFE